MLYLTIMMPRTKTNDAHYEETPGPSVAALEHLMRTAPAMQKGIVARISTKKAAHGELLGRYERTNGTWRRDAMRYDSDTRTEYPWRTKTTLPSAPPEKGQTPVRASKPLTATGSQSKAAATSGVKVVDRMDNRDVMVKKGKTDYVVTHEGFAFKELPKGQANPLVKATRQAQGLRPFPKKKVRF